MATPNNDNQDYDAKLSEIVPSNNHSNSEYSVYDLNDKEDRKLFGNALIKQSFALIKIPKKYQSSINDLFGIFKKLFTSKQSLKCEHNLRYIGYTSTPNIKQSLWLNLNKKNDTLFPSLQDNKSVLYESDNYQKVINGYKNYNSIAKDAIHATLEHTCKDKQSYIKCYNDLFPHDKNENDNEDETKEKKNTDYPECAVYHKYRKIHDLHLNNLAVIHYYGDNTDNKANKKKKGVGDPCGLHIDYTVITLIIADESGLTVFDKYKGKFVEIGVDLKDVIIVITGLTLALLTDSDINPEIGISFPTPCQHKVLRSYKNDRISFPLFCYADPNGVVDTSLIKNTTNHIKVNIADYLVQEMRHSVNF